MAIQVEYHPESKIEIREAADWYDYKVDGLGLEFLLELRSAESQVTNEPEMWPVYEGETRRYLLKRFPFSVIYITSENKIQIVAVAHNKRKPGYWKKRLKTS